LSLIEFSKLGFYADDRCAFENVGAAAQNLQLGALRIYFQIIDLPDCGLSRKFIERDARQLLLVDDPEYVIGLPALDNARIRLRARLDEMQLTMRCEVRQVFENPGRANIDDDQRAIELSADDSIQGIRGFSLRQPRLGIGHVV